MVGVCIIRFVYESLAKLRWEFLGYGFIWIARLYSNMLKRRKESGTYLATDGRNRWSLKMTMKKDNYM